MKRIFLVIALMQIIFMCAYSQEASLETIVQTGHYNPILDVDFSPDSRLIATASQDNTIKLWEVSTGRELRTFIGHDESVRSVCFSPNGEKLISVGWDNKAILWDVALGSILKTWTDSLDEIRNAIFSPSGKYVLTGGHKTNAILWNVETGEKEKTFQTKPPVCYQCEASMVFSKDEKTLYTSGADRTTIIWNTNKADTIATLKFSKGSCSSCNTQIDIDPTGTILAKADYGGGLYTIDIKTGKIIKQFTENEDFGFIQFHPSGKYLLGLVGYYGDVKVWDLKSGKVIQEISKDVNKRIRAARFSPDGKNIITVGDDNTAKLWNFGNGKLVQNFKGIVTKIDAEGIGSSELYFINLLSDTELSPDGKYVAQCKRGKSAIIWDFKTGRIIKKLSGHEAVVSCLSFSPDSKTLATGSGDRTIKLWDVESGDLIRTINAHGALVLSVKYSKDGRFIISGSWDGYFRVWNAETGEFVSGADVHDGSPYSVCLTPNNLYAVTGGLDQTLKLTELDSRTEVRAFIGHTKAVQSINFSPDETSFVSSGWDGAVKLWDVRTGWQIRKFTGHTGAVYHASFDSTGQYLVTGSEDKTAKLWNVKTGELIRTFSGHKGGVLYAQITPDGKQLITASRDHTVKIWDLNSGKELVTHITLNEDQWMAKTNDGFFEGTNAATKTLFFVKGTTSYSLDQFFEQFYKPGIYKQAITSTKREVAGNNIIGLLENSPPPKIEVLSPFSGDICKNNYKEIMIDITNTGGGINEIRFMQNEKRLDIENKLSRTPKTGQDMIQSYSINLVPGKNDITITGFSDGRVESKPVKLELFYEGTQKTSNLYVVAVGINEYKNALLSLNYARADAESFVKLLDHSTKKLFNKVETIVLLDTDATKANIIAKLDELSKVITKEDVFYFFYAGHGSALDNDFYFIPNECVSLYQKDKLEAEAISATTLNEKLRIIPALKQVVILDACHSGASTQILASRGMQEEKALAQLARSTGIHIMAAAGSEQQATEFGVLGHGVFTYALLEALSGLADGAPKDKKVTIYELKSYLDDQVPELSKKYQGSTQYPSTFSLGQDFPMVLTE